MQIIQSIQASQKPCEYFFHFLCAVALHFLTKQWQLKVIHSCHRGDEGSGLAMELELLNWFDRFYSLAKSLRRVGSKMSLPEIYPTTDSFLNKFLV